MTKQGIRNTLIFGGIILLSILGFLYTEFMQSLPQDYTIGTINKIWKPVKGGKQVNYKYYVNGEEYEGNIDYHGYESVAQPGRRFLVQYPEDYKHEGRMILDIPIPDGIEAPPNGWSERPSFKKK